MNRFGYIKNDNYTYTYQIGDRAMADQAPDAGIPAMDPDSSKPLAPLSVKNYYVAPSGPDNLTPNTADEMISGNRLLPELIDKQVRILNGSGPMLYRTILDSDGLPHRQYTSDQRIQGWLDSWRENGLPDSFDTYINKAIRSYYYSESIYTKWHVSRGKAVNLRGSLPISGLEHISELRCRFCTRRNISNRTDLTLQDYDSVMVGNWKASNESEFRVYPLFDFLNPFVNSAISYSNNPTHGDDVYAYSVFFRGIKSWIQGCNSTPEYINSYLENALSARLHIIIPNAWYAAKETSLKGLCELNKQREDDKKDPITIKVGSKTLEIGTVYSDALLEKYTMMELKNLTNFLSGRGKNQGKVYATRSFMNEKGDEERWKIEEVPQKYKEFIEAILEYDKRSDMVLLSAKGIDPSISNVSSDGIISKSGSDAYYNYMIYLSQQYIPESVVCSDINYAIKLNFPDLYASGIRLGFYRPVIARQQDVTPSARMDNSNM